MPQYKTPGVFIEEISKLPPSVAAVATAVPVFIGYTEKAVAANGDSLTDVPTRITSLLDFETRFGFAETQAFSVNVDQTRRGDPALVTETIVSFDGTPPSVPDHFLYYAVQLFYANGGGPCYIVSLGDYATPFDVKDFTDAINSLETVDEPTLLVFPDACSKGSDEVKVGDIIDAALVHCNKMQDRFTIADVHDAVPTGTADNAAVTDKFRDEIASDLGLVKYGAAYFPYLRTSLPFRTTDDDVTIKAHKLHTIDADGVVTDTNGGAAGKVISDAAVRDAENAAYNAVRQFVGNATVTIPPSGGVAGAYARTDAARGVWKAPANVSLLNVIGPAIAVTNDLNDNLNIDTTAGKSVNAIRAFTGRGTLVWGARTLAGNDAENRYVPVRRFLIFVEESVKKATMQFVFEPNDANTWVKVRGMIENFLTVQWRDGALAGAKPEDAFYVAIGLNRTMTAQDVLDGYMIVEIGMAIVRPAEFIVLRFVQLMQKS